MASGLRSSLPILQECRTVEASFPEWRHVPHLLAADSFKDCHGSLQHRTYRDLSKGWPGTGIEPQFHHKDCGSGERRHQVRKGITAGCRRRISVAPEFLLAVSRAGRRSHRRVRIDQPEPLHPIWTRMADWKIHRIRTEGIPGRYANVDS